MDQQQAGPQPPYDLGVLMVHGIGEQHLGETLTQFGEPFIESLRRWMMRQTGGSVDCVRVTEAVLLPEKTFKNEPAHCVVEFDLPATNSNPAMTQKWLICEDCWADQVVPPKSGEFLSWLLTRGPAVILSHFMDRWLDSPKTTSLGRKIYGFALRFRRRPWFPAQLRTGLRKNPALHRMFSGALSILVSPRPFQTVFLTSNLLALLLQIPLLFAAMVAALPIPGISRWVSSAVFALGKVVGDSFVLIRVEAQRGAILTHFTRSLEHLNGCNKIAIVAHSQGTAVVCQVLRRRPALRPDLLITFGSGVAKLDQLYIGEASRRLALSLSGFLPPLLAVTFSGVLAIPFAMERLTTLGFVGYIFGLGVVFTGYLALTLYVLFNLLHAKNDLRNYYRGQGRMPMLARRWHDFNAKCDPVPTAPLQETFGLRTIESTPVSNRDSYLSDHTSYLDNFAQFVLPVTRLLAEEAGLPAMSSDIRLDADRLRRHHSKAVVLLSATLVVSFVLSSLIAFFFWGRFQSAGEALWRNIPWGLLPNWIRTIGSAFRVFGPFVALIPFDQSQWKGVFATALLLLATSIYRIPFGFVWSWWKLASMESSIQHGWKLEGILSWGQLAILGLFAILPQLILIAALAFTDR